MRERIHRVEGKGESGMDEPKLRIAIAKLVQFRTDLEFVPAQQRLQKLGRGLYVQLNNLKYELNEALSDDGRFLFPSIDCDTVAAAYTLTGRWLIQLQSVCPQVVSGMLSQPEQTPPFGFAAHSSLAKAADGS